jgi:hypothetical protein
MLQRRARLGRLWGEVVRRRVAVMDERRKRAYRHMLYWAMLDIRPLGWLSAGPLRTWNPLFWRKEAERVRRAGVLADWLHNLALFSALDFARFDEDWFWRDFQQFHKRHPEFGLERYRSRFEEQLAVVGYENEDAEPPAAPDRAGP